MIIRFNLSVIDSFAGTATLINEYKMVYSNYRN